jgi:hypothetical protein
VITASPLLAGATRASAAGRPYAFMQGVDSLPGLERENWLNVGGHEELQDGSIRCGGHAAHGANRAAFDERGARLSSLVLLVLLVLDPNQVLLSFVKIKAPLG